MLTDVERAELNRLLAQDESDMTVDDLLQLPAGAVSLFRILVKSQQALGEIRRKAIRVQAHLDLLNKHSIEYAKLRALEIENIACNAIGGK